jgi:hypothetical protein
MALSKLAFIMDQYGWKSELPDNFWWKSYQISTKPMKQFVGYVDKSIYGFM